jgi:hypothetical protein
MVRQPLVAISKDVMGLACKTLHEYRQWIFGVGTGGISLFGDIPIFAALYRRMREVGVSSNVKRSLLFSDSGFARMSTKPRRHAEQRTITDDCRLSFFRAFGISPDLQFEIEHQLSITPFDSVIEDPGVGLSFALPLADHLGNEHFN